MRSRITTILAVSLSVLCLSGEALAQMTGIRPVPAQPRPCDLVVSNFQIVSPPVVRCGGMRQITYTYTETNNGPGPAPAFRVGRWGNYNSPPNLNNLNQAWGSSPRPPLGAGQSRPVTDTGWFNAGPSDGGSGTATLYFQLWVDFANQVVETNDNNNTSNIVTHPWACP